jgi:hypothetical protein
MRREGFVGFTLIGAVVGALVLASCTNSTSAAPGSETPSTAPTTSAAPSPSASSTSSVTLTGLTIDQPSWKADPKGWKVTLSWDTPAGFEVDHYQVARDGRMVADDVSHTTYTDADAEPGTTYRYAVKAVDASGTTTQPASAAVQTGRPPLADARLEGRFVMKLHITSQSGLRSGAHGGGIVFVFSPTCHSGPCNVVWSLQGSSGSGTLIRNDATYGGTVHAPFFVRSCRGGAINETLVFHLRVGAGEASRGGWRASKIEGTLDETAPAFGCVTAHLSYRLTGFVQH